MIREPPRHPESQELPKSRLQSLSQSWHPSYLGGSQPLLAADNRPLELGVFCNRFGKHLRIGLLRVELDSDLFFGNIRLHLLVACNLDQGCFHLRWSTAWSMHSLRSYRSHLHSRSRFHHLFLMRTAYPQNTKKPQREGHTEKTRDTFHTVSFSRLSRHKRRDDSQQEYTSKEPQAILNGQQLYSGFLPPHSTCPTFP